MDKRRNHDPLFARQIVSEVGFPPVLVVSIKGSVMSERTLNITSASYEIASWVAVFQADDGGNKIASVINIERLREIVAAADKDLALLVAREGGTA